MTRVLALADQSKIGCITQRRFAKVGTKTHPQRGADLDRNGLSVSTETACRFEPKSPVGNSEICSEAEIALGLRPIERYPVAGSFLQRRMVGGHRLLQTRRAALPLRKPPQCEAKI